jgi:hypothetical protein
MQKVAFDFKKLYEKKLSLRYFKYLQYSRQILEGQDANFSFDLKLTV